MKQIFSFGLAVTLVIGGAVAIPPLAEATGVSKGRAYEIARNYNARVADLKSNGGNEASCIPGTASAAAIKDILDTTNDLRELAGLSPVKNLVSANANAQAAALVMAANGDLEHDIPANWKCYSASAQTGASTSNLSLGWPTFPAKMVVSGQWEDATVSSLGHRRWLMKPDLDSVAIGGFAGANSASGVIGTMGSGATDNSNPQPDGISWPPSGYIPQIFVPQGAGNWWHISLKCSLTDLGVTVTGPTGPVYSGNLTQLAPYYGGSNYQAYSIAAPKVPDLAPGAEIRYTVTLTKPCNTFKSFTTKILGEELTPVTAIAPIVTKIVGPDNDKVSLTNTVGMSWADTGWVNHKRTVSAKAAAGHYLTGKSEWTFTDAPIYVAVPTPKVTPLPGGHNDIIETIPTTGVTYQDTNWAAGKRRITAVPTTDDYVLTGTITWVFNDGPPPTVEPWPEPWPYPGWIPYVDRWAGKTAIDTALTISRNSIATENPTGLKRQVFLANDLGFQDALAAVPAAAMGQGSLLLTSPSAVTPAAIEELKRIAPETVTIQGGKYAVSTGVESSLKLALSRPNDPQVRRIFGSDDIDTAIATARQMRKIDRVFIANNRSFQDALGAGPIAARLNAAILLIDPDKPLPNSVREFLSERKFSDVTIIGGRFAVPETIAADIVQTIGVTPKRVSGATDIDTTLAVAGLLPQHKQIFLTNNIGFQDALGAGPAAALSQGTVLLTNGKCVERKVLDKIAQLKPSEIHIIGGRFAMDPALEKLAICPPRFAD